MLVKGSASPLQVRRVAASLTVVPHPDRRRNNSRRAYRTSGRRATDQPDLPAGLGLDSQTLPALNRAINIRS